MRSTSSVSRLLFAVLTLTIMSPSHTSHAQDDASQPGGCPAGKSCVTMFHNQNARKGVNANESSLTHSAVQSGFHRLFSVNVDDPIYAQPLVLPNVCFDAPTCSNLHNVVYAATENNSVYALDADTGATVWSTDPISLTLSNMRVVHNTDLPPSYCPNIEPDIGITGTPVIDISGNSGGHITQGTLYVVSRSTDGTTFKQTLNAVNVVTGAFTTADIRGPLQLMVSRSTHSFKISAEHCFCKAPPARGMYT
jgi:hypothetical protein